MSKISKNLRFFSRSFTLSLNSTFRYWKFECLIDLCSTCFTYCLFDTLLFWFRLHVYFVINYDFLSLFSHNLRKIKMSFVVNLCCALLTRTYFFFFYLIPFLIIILADFNVSVPYASVYRIHTYCCVCMGILLMVCVRSVSMYFSWLIRFVSFHPCFAPVGCFAHTITTLQCVCWVLFSFEQLHYQKRFYIFSLSRAFR